MRWLLTLAGTLAYLALAVCGEGGPATFFSKPPLVAYVAIFALMALAAVLAPGGNISSGVREDRSNRWVLVPFIVIGLALGFVPAYTDRIGFLTIDGDAVRWLGVALTAIGGTLRIYPVYVLGNRFSGLVAIQQGHRLVTTGIYRVIRHPSYLGLFISAAGWSLAFRSGLGLIMTACFVPPLVSRMNSEEALLASQFGAEYDAYRARTFRLLPGIY